MWDLVEVVVERMVLVEVVVEKRMVLVELVEEHMVLVEEVAYSAYQMVVVLSAYQSPVYQQVVVAVPVYLN